VDRLETGTQRQFTAKISAFPEPDLVFSALSATISSTGQVVVSSSVKNQGTLPTSGSFTIAFYLSLDGALDRTDVLLGTRSRSSSLKVGVTDDATSKFFPPSGIVPGIYYVTGFVDAGFTQIESDESNNQATSAGTVAIKGGR